ncbi:FAD-dependent oxidoreductase [Pelagovum sp. HNIBRBA483]|uniref:FAD-dependent oxidoreductase n=1 Tax=Pelagovum sp. HNIBRBA483 TaxID=3233341 RepID=UPI0034A3CAFE
MPKTPISAHGEKNQIELDVSIDGRTEKIACDTLVIACEPRNLRTKISYSDDEVALLSSLHNFTFHTSLLKVKVKDRQMKHGVIFAAEPLSKMRGHIYGFRNETAKSLGLDFANSVEYNWVTVYQLFGETTTPPTEDDFRKLLAEEIAQLSWWPFERSCDGLQETVLTPYFDHFHGDQLVNQNPWNWHKIQGDNNTIYVHAATCFESVVHCWYYINWLFEGHDGGRAIFPEDKSTSIVILGAGPSGLLTAEALKHRHYTNVRVLENTNRIGGKTHTVPVKQYGNLGKATTLYCELGTCYLSPHYDKFVKKMHHYLDGNTQIGFGGEDGTFRGILTEGQFSEHFRKTYDPPKMMPFPKYVLYKAADWLNVSPSHTTVIEDAIKAAAVNYERLYWEYFDEAWFSGPHYPMPAEPPADFLRDYGHKSFEQFLIENHMGVLLGIMQYAYSVQGYGTLNDIPAYYGLLWITPDIIAKAQAGDGKTTLITAWSRGWGDLWEQMSAHLDITLNAETTHIRRHAHGQA